MGLGWVRGRRCLKGAEGLTMSLKSTFYKGVGGGGQVNGAVVRAGWGGRGKLQRDNYIDGKLQN